jgi:hydrogenase maturation protease
VSGDAAVAVWLQVKQHDARAHVGKSIILGIGNVLLTDEGAGVHVARRLALQLADRGGVHVVDGGTLGFALAPLIQDAHRLIVLDAMQLNRPPGSVQRFLDAEVDKLLSHTRLSVHEIGLRDVLAISQLTGSCPPQRALIGIQPASLGWGTEPTAPVAQALDTAAGMALGLLEDPWPSAALKDGLTP